MEGVAVNGKSLPVSSAAFSNASRGTVVVDTGTMLTYLDSEMYDALMDVISGIVSHQVESYFESSTGKLCYYVTSRETTEIFPQVAPQFAYGVLLVLRPQDYLTSTAVDGSRQICMGFQTAEEFGSPILGEIALTDKIVVYDLYQKRLGWSSTFNCSLHIDVDTQYGFTNDGGYMRCRYDHHLWVAATAFFVLFVVLV